jgi:nucleotide-binding universal stress UspA family protein
LNLEVIILNVHYMVEVNGSDRAQSRPIFELGTDGPTTIVVGVDGSATSLRAAAYAAGLARRQHSRLAVVFARHTLVPPMLTGAADSGYMLATAEVNDSVVADLLAVWPEFQEVCPSATLIVRDGDPSHALAEVAADLRADAIVVGASAGKGHRIVGSTGARLIRQNHWPVTVVP